MTDEMIAKVREYTSVSEEMPENNGNALALERIAP